MTGPAIKVPLCDSPNPRGITKADRNRTQACGPQSAKLLRPPMCLAPPGWEFPKVVRGPTFFALSAQQSRHFNASVLAPWNSQDPLAAALAPQLAGLFWRFVPIQPAITKIWAHYTPLFSHYFPTPNTLIGPPDSLCPIYSVPLVAEERFPGILGALLETVSTRAFGAHTLHPEFAVSAANVAKPRVHKSPSGPKPFSSHTL